MMPAMIMVQQAEMLVWTVDLHINECVQKR